MEHFNVVMSLIGVIFICIIGVYAWTFKVYKDTKACLGDVYNVINGHLQKADIHSDKKDFVSAEVCVVIHEGIRSDLVEIKSDVKSLLAR